MSRTSSSHNTWLVRLLRSYRKWHRYIGVGLSALVLVSAVTGLLLGWKKDASWLQPPTQRGAAESLADWLPLHDIAQYATQALQDSIHVDIDIDRMDARPSKGIVKVLFTSGNWEVQVDAATGQALSIQKRHADWIEQLHDGSIVSSRFKLITMNVLGIGLVILALSGLWLWYGPQRLKQLKRKKES